MTGLTHFDAQGQAVMVDVGAKAVTARRATAQARIVMEPATQALIRQGTARKGDVLGTARLAGIMAAKRTADLIPLCHPLALDKVSIDFAFEDETTTEAALRIEATVACTGRTGVEMQALTAATIAALTIYDMCKAVDRGMRIEAVRLLRKEGGKSGQWP